MVASHSGLPTYFHTQQFALLLFRQTSPRIFLLERGHWWSGMRVTADEGQRVGATSVSHGVGEAVVLSVG